MRGVGVLVGPLLLVAIYGIGLWILWKFYRAFARIGEELSEIKTILHDRLGRTQGPSA